MTKARTEIILRGDTTRQSDRRRMTAVETRFTNMYDGAFTNGGIVPWVSPTDTRTGDLDAIVDPSAIADRTRRKASAATGAQAPIDAPAAIADRSGNRRTRNVRRVARRAGASRRDDAACARRGCRRDMRYAQPSDTFWRLIWTLDFFARAIRYG